MKRFCRNRPDHGPAWMAWILFCAAHAICLGVAPGELHQKKLDGERWTVVDIRSQSLFDRGHIPGAINIPSSLISQKRLPPLGKVAVCGSGLGFEDVETAVNELNAKPGVDAELLEGGFAAWESMVGQSTQKPGLHEETLPFITYDKVKAAFEQDMVLVDLRKREQPAIGLQSLPANEKTDLRREFPGVPVVSTPFQGTVSLQSAGAPRQSVPPLMVLIDDNDGKAQETARLLKAQGVRRVVILAGGEEILKRQGRPGLQRVGASYDLSEDANNFQTPNPDPE